MLETRDLESLIDSLRAQVEELEHRESNSEPIQDVADSIISLIDSLPFIDSLNKKQKALLLYYKGRALVAVNIMDRRAEESLSKSIKLDPTSIQAWNWLGEVFYHKKDYKQSKQCFEGGIEISGENKDSLRKLSMVKRFLGENEERKLNVKESVDLAKRAVSMDICDGFSWYVLGNAHLTNFFTNNPTAEELNTALKAYAQAERNLAKPIPDLFYNRGTAYKFLESYQSAFNEFQRAHSLDSTLNADSACASIYSQISQIMNCINTKCRLKKKALINILASIPTSLTSQPFSVPYKLSTIDQLKLGTNTGTILACKLVSVISQDINSTPAIFIVTDKLSNFFVLSLYNSSQGTFEHLKFASGIFIKDACLFRVVFEGMEYLNVRVSDPNNFMVDNKIIKEAFTPSQVINQAL